MREISERDLKSSCHIRQACLRASFLLYLIRHDTSVVRCCLCALMCASSNIQLMAGCFFFDYFFKNNSRQDVLFTSLETCETRKFEGTQHCQEDPDHFDLY